MDSIFSKHYSNEKSHEFVSVPYDEAERANGQEYDIADATAAVLEEQPVWEVIARWGVYMLAFLTPLWFLPLTIGPVDINKGILDSVFAIIGFIAWLGMAVYQGKLLVPRS